MESTLPPQRKHPIAPKPLSLPLNERHTLREDADGLPAVGAQFLRYPKTDMPEQAVRFRVVDQTQNPYHPVTLSTHLYLGIDYPGMVVFEFSELAPHPSCDQFPALDQPLPGPLKGPAERVSPRFRYVSSEMGQPASLHDNEQLGAPRDVDREVPLPLG